MNETLKYTIENIKHKPNIENVIKQEIMNYFYKEYFKLDSEQVKYIESKGGLKGFISYYNAKYSNNQGTIDLMDYSIYKKIKGKDINKLIANIDEIYKSLDNLQKKFTQANFKFYDIENLIKTDKGLAKLFKFLNISLSDILSGKEINVPSFYETSNFLTSVSALFKYKQELKDIYNETKNNLNLFVTLNYSNFDFTRFMNLNISLDEIEKHLENIRNLSSTKLQTILNKPLKDLSIEDIKEIRNMNISSLVYSISWLESIGLVTPNKQKLNTLKDRILLANNISFVKRAITNSSEVNQQTTGGILNKETTTFIDQDIFILLDQLTIDKEKLLNLENADVAIRTMTYILLNFEEITKNYSQKKKQELFNKIKKAFSNFKKTSWYTSLSELYKNQLEYIVNMLQVSKDYKEYKNNIKLFEKKSKRALKLIELLDIYSKGMTGKGIDGKEKLVGYIIKGNFNGFLYDYEKLYKQIQSEAEGDSEMDGYELAKVFGDDSDVFLNFGKVKQYLNDTNTNFLDGGSKFFDKLNNLVDLMLDEGSKDEWIGNSKVKTNLQNIDILSIFVKEYYGDNTLGNLIKKDKNGNTIIEGQNGISLTITSDDVIFDKGKTSFRFDTGNKKIIEKNDKLIFDNLSIEIKNGMPDGIDKRFEELYPALKLDDKTYKKIIKEFEKTYKIIRYVQDFTNAPIPYDLLKKFNDLSYLLFGKTSVDIFDTQKNSKDIDYIKDELVKISIEKSVDNIMEDKEVRKKMNKVVEDQWEQMPLFERQLICNKLSKNNPNCGSKNIDPTVRDVLVKKLAYNIVLRKKTEYEFAFLNAQKSGSISSLTLMLKKLEISFSDYIKNGIDFLVKELIPIVIAEIVGTALDFTGVGASIGVALQVQGYTKFARTFELATKGANYLVRYGGVEAGTYTLVSNRIHGNQFSPEIYAHNAMYFLIPGIFGKGGGFIGSKLGAKWGTEGSKLSYYGWTGGSAVVGLEATKYVVDGKFDITEIPGDILFLLLLHGTHEGLKKIGIEHIKGLVWKPATRKKPISMIKTGYKEIKSKFISEKQLSEFNKALKDINGREILLNEGNTYIVLSKEGDLYLLEKKITIKGRNGKEYVIDKISYKPQNTFSSISPQKVFVSYDPVKIENIRKVESTLFKTERINIIKTKDGGVYKVEVKDGKINIQEVFPKEKAVDKIFIANDEIIIGETTNGEIYLFEKSEEIARKIGDTTTKEGFERFVSELEKLGFLEKTRNLDSRLEGIQKSELFKLYVKLLEEAKTNKNINAEVIKELKQAEAIIDEVIKDDNEIKKLEIFKKIKEMYKKRGISESKADENAEKTTKSILSSTKDMFVKSVSLLASGVGTTIKYTALGALLAGGGLAIDYGIDQELDAWKRLKDNFGDEILAVKNNWLGTGIGAVSGNIIGGLVFKNRLLGNIFTTILGAVAGLEIQKNWGNITNMF